MAFLNSELAFILVRHAKQENLKEVLNRPVILPLQVVCEEGSISLLNDEDLRRKKTTLFRELIRRISCKSTSVHYISIM